ncbi:hypothetical protein TVAG_332870 [Trichomonas vaginalis G3]|uniref:Bap-like n=1 Tax=Trichomonas vaginalis (strain ATCC PRA-98 / G3) TaxID=412133 RepID=A2EH83_TRIV3|nr:hypothetical protein TVAGG3_0933590 [Trichomonas vaginalis G3]EAY07962.1 hypothetical protein TVAG_332870 [Trichomonas vaginalis G3]KAI5486009.1 hypothetical protein TVAGG3_0933590 [Trichomonas vaginalis G3]|eukprot:XP_001320185.1 hypothetical protein [Trichomonas vaginalis G3]
MNRLYSVSFEVIVVKNKPTLTITTQNKQEIYKCPNDISFHVEGQVVDLDHTGAFSLYYIIDSSNAIKYQNTFIISSSPTSIDIYIPISRNINEGTHNIIFYVIDESSERSNEVNIEFTYISHKPTLYITTPDNQQLRKNTNTFILIEGQVEDLDGSGTVTIYYNLDNTNEKQLTSLTISSTSKQNFANKIDFPTNFFEGTHNIKLYCIDEQNKKSNEITIKFTFNYNAPTLFITTSDNQVFKKNDGQSFIISGSVQDLDGSGTVTIYYQFDGQNQAVAQTQTISQTTSYPVYKIIEFPSNFPESNSHYINIWATDEANKNSLTITKKFFISL